MRRANTNTAEIAIEDVWDDDTLSDFKVRQWEEANSRLHEAAVQALRREVARLTAECASLRAERDILLLTKKSQ